MKYAVVAENEGQHSVRMMCRALTVSPGGYYEWRKRKPSRRTRQRAALDTVVDSAFRAQKGRAGAPRLTHGLKQQGINAGHNQVAESLRRQGLRAKAARKFKATTNSAHSLPVAPNLLQQNFSAERPNQAWVADITFVDTAEGWLYLAVVLDLFSRRVVGWSMSDRMTATANWDNQVSDFSDAAARNQQQTGTTNFQNFQTLPPEFRHKPGQPSVRLFRPHRRHSADSSPTSTVSVQQPRNQQTRTTTFCQDFPAWLPPPQE
ncbi:IS3 family transposase [Tahibacter amnicola]|uniref:IS3 family transposase n=1 Tax=Tahibacter amnicola TaxID=2976241 RepID=A0ABY6BK92_9GAMM|nr:IS3 family transposase [Tahibacter amnicola]UXI70319.1 IS3 family transposase [Tahibacter amnicola]